jgi:hypothetical protein
MRASTLRAKLMRIPPSRLDANVLLAADAHAGGDFFITAHTSNGPLALAVPDSPADSKLVLTARTSNKPAEVRLHGAYQGAFSVSTSNDKPEVKQMDEKGDNRQVEYAGGRGGRRGGEVKGYVYEKERNKELGSVVVRTWNAPAVLWV